MRRILLVAILAVAVTLTLFSVKSSEEPISLGPNPVSQKASLLGKTIPPFSAETIDGEYFPASQLRARVLVVNIWGTWCKPCVEEMPRLESEIQGRFTDYVTVLAVSPGEDVQKLRQFNDKHRFGLPIVADEKKEISKFFPGNTFPRTFVIDRRGRVVFELWGTAGFEQLVAAVENAI